MSGRLRATHDAAESLSPGAEIVHPLTEEEEGATRFTYRDRSGRMIDVGSHA
jgi:hypothetical protein